MHELAHQWFGDDVTVESWSDICMNECFASYAEWLWAEHNGDRSGRSVPPDRRRQKDRPGWWQTPLVTWVRATSSATSTAAGRWRCTRCGTRSVTRSSPNCCCPGSRSTAAGTPRSADFEDMVDQIAGKDESAFMDAWFRKTGVPADEFLWPGDLHP